MINILLAIPKDREQGYKYIVNACNELNVKYELYDIYSANWVDDIKKINPKGIIYRPEFRYRNWRIFFNERIEYINQYLGIPVYPSLKELSLYESKRNMAYFAMLNSLPYPKTYIFGNKEEAIKFAQTTSYPIVFKTDFGNASQGVKILKNKKQAIEIINAAFGNGYKIKPFDDRKLDLWNRFKFIVRPFYRKLFGIRNIPPDFEIDSVIFQEFIEIKKEWRIVKIGNSYFGHDKLPDERGFNSGSGLTSWAIPPKELFYLIKDICDKHKFNSMAFDVFENIKGEYLISELQTVFGVVAKNQMHKKINGQLIPFRFYFDTIMNDFKEELGNFGQNYCYNLRVQDFLNQLK